MRVHILQHVPFEGPGSIGRWLDAHGVSVTTDLPDGPRPYPPVGEIDGLVILGGPMSVNDESSLPWLAREKAYIREATTRNLRVLGVCLGAQLIAAALGARVHRNPVKEIGWYPVRGLRPSPPAFQFPGEFTAFHWHGETFDLPAGAVRLASSAGCENQAFQIGRRIIGLQFHLETTPDGISALVDHCRHELVPAPYIQTAREMLDAPPSLFAAPNALMANLLDFLLLEP
jgi:GMP synthase-like glutamine amidotransferase